MPWCGAVASRSTVPTEMGSISLQIGLGSRIRKSLFHDALMRHGLTHVTVYNHMHIPPSLSGLAGSCQAGQD